MADRPDRAEHTDRERTELRDAQAMRAYAHPLRRKLVVLLRRFGPQTATEAAKALGDNVPNCSFHLRQLAKYGLVERVEGSDNRERPWRAVAMTTSWDDSSDDPDRRAAADFLVENIVSGYFEATRAWLAVRDRETAEWRHVTGVTDQTLHVTIEELGRVEADIAAVLERFYDRNSDPSLRPEGSRAINLMQLIIPWEMP
ncbi:MAG TPA: helix-turn-helix domain-containing protein [Micromonosporaceae bacterium]|jgi:predicted ArsR family transcriptional regulator